MKRFVSTLCLFALLSVTTLAGDGVMFPDFAPPPPPPAAASVPDPLTTAFVELLGVMAALVP